MADTQDLVYKPADEVGSLRNNLRNHQKIMELPRTLTKINTKMGREGVWEWKSKNSKKQETQELKSDMPYQTKSQRGGGSSRTQKFRFRSSHKMIEVRNLRKKSNMYGWTLTFKLGGQSYLKVVLLGYFVRCKGLSGPVKDMRAEPLAKNYHVFLV